mgnify:CR=1 FL=1
MNQNNLQTFIAKRIRYLRLTKGLSQEKLSELAGLGSKHIHNIENEKYNYKFYNSAFGNSFVVRFLGVKK